MFYARFYREILTEEFKMKDMTQLKWEYTNFYA